ncbi:MAG TPA: hypothetical protein VJ652_22715 [Noviherbaspirillum sp.]|nr:hypothetical protein [Noviherbaspirillum sp.]
MTPADRKKQLIAEGRIYRAELMLAKETVRSGLQPETLARNALTRIALVALSVLRNRGSTMPGLNLPALLPLAISGVSALAKRKSLLKATLVAGVAASAVAFVAKIRRTSEPAQEQDPSG